MELEAKSEVTTRISDFGFRIAKWCSKGQGAKSKDARKSVITPLPSWLLLQSLHLERTSDGRKNLHHRPEP
jgi:hypothetical protein